MNANEIDVKKQEKYHVHTISRSRFSLVARRLRLNINNYEFAPSGNRIRSQEKLFQPVSPTFSIRSPVRRLFFCYCSRYDC